MRHIGFFAGCAVVSLLSACATPTPTARGAAVIAPAKAFPFPTTQITLANGLRVFVVQYDSPGLVAYYSVVRVGSRNEVEPGKSGFAHFFEHMMFRGTATYPADKYNATLKAMGADSNAFTSDDMTVYHILASATALPTVVAIEADRFQNLAYAQPEFEKEARAVLGEYNKSASDPMQPMAEALYDNAFRVHTYKHTTIGFLRDITAMPKQLDYSRQFFDRYYRPDNVILLVVGDVTADKVLPLIERHYGDWQRGPARPGVPVEPPQTEGKRVVVPWKGDGMPMLLVGYHTPAFSTQAIDGVALEVLAELVFAERAPLFRRLVLDEQKVEHLDGACERHVDPNLFHVLARIKNAKDIPYVEAAIDQELARIARDGVDARTIAEVVSHMRYAFARSLSTADRTALVAAEFLALTGELDSIDEAFARLSQVTAADIQRVAATYFTPANRTTVVLAPEAS